MPLNSCLTHMVWQIWCCQCLLPNQTHGLRCFLCVGEASFWDPSRSLYPLTGSASGSDERGHWCAGGSNYSVPVPGAAGSQLAKENPLAGFEDALSRTIVDCEVNADQWTLMHRYNKATELLEQAVNVRPSPL